MINVIHRTAKSSGNNYVVVSSITPLPKRVECPEQVIPSFEFNYDDKFGNLDQIDEWTQNKIKETDEYKAKQETTPVENVVEEVVESLEDLAF